MKKGDLFQFEEAVAHLKNLEGVKFNYAITKNKRMIQNEIEIIREMFSTPTDTVKKYQEDRKELQISHSKKDKDGNPIMKKVGKEDHYDIEDMEKFKLELKEFEEKNKEVLEEMKKKDEEIEKLLDEDCGLDFHKIKDKDIPANITGLQMDIIFDMIDFEI